MRFEEIQAMPKAWTLLSILPGLLLMFGALREGVAEGVVPLPLVLLAVALTLIFGLWFRRLSLITEVDDTTVTLRYQGLLKTRTVPISTVRSARARTYRPLLEYGGWGIKFGPKGWVYNVSGKEGVQLELDGARPLLIGSRRADDLVEAITLISQVHRHRRGRVGHVGPVPEITRQSWKLSFRNRKTCRSPRWTHPTPRQGGRL